MTEHRKIVVEPVPAAPGWYAYAKDYEEEYGSSFGWTPEDASRSHLMHIDLVDEARGQ